MKCKYLWLIVLCFTCVLSACSQDGDKYHKEIRALGLQEQFDEAKWNLYCIHSDIVPKFIKWDGQRFIVLPEKNITYGALDLVFDSVIVKHDTVELTFRFVFDSKKLGPATVDNIKYSGVAFINNKVYAYLTDTHISYIRYPCEDLNNCLYRESKPLQPEVVSYIKHNKHEINEWFIQEAIKRGVMNSATSE